MLPPWLVDHLMIVLSVQNLSRQFDAEPVFRDVCFDLRAGEKVGLVGPNGCGKTTLLSVLAGQDDPDQGTIDIPSRVQIQLLRQQADPPTGRSLVEEVRSGLNHLYALQNQAAELAERMACCKDENELGKLQNQYDTVHSELDRLDAYHVEHRVDEVLQGLGFQKEDYHRDLATFSGGQQNRAALARLLLADPEVLLLDEPTNHLDMETTQWLESYLTRSSQAMIVVSHDRYFLDRVTTRTLELWQGGISDYAGNFSTYWEQRAERLKVLQRTYDKQQAFIAKTKDFIRRNAYGQKHAQAKDREKKLERLEHVELPKDFADLVMGFPQPRRTGDWVLRAESISKGFPNNEGKIIPLFQDLTLQIDRGDRVGILGPNGAGKTTLLRVLLGELPPESGHVRFGTGVEIGYFDQQLTSVDASVDAVEAVRQSTRHAGNTPWAAPDPFLKPGEVRKMLARFGVRGDLALQQVGQMSGGERTKVALARLSALNPSLMFLDEPTNHLDFWACAALERSLREFQGTVLFVSHDRYFIDRVATKVLVLEDGRWRIHEGNYTDYQAFLNAVGPGTMSPSQAAQPIAASSKNKGGKGTGTEAQGSPRRRRKFKYRKIEDIEADIEACEQQILDLETAMADPETHRNGQRMREIQEDYEMAQRELEQLLEHWEEAAEWN